MSSGQGPDERLDGQAEERAEGGVKGLDLGGEEPSLSPVCAVVRFGTQGYLTSDDTL